MSRQTDYDNQNANAAKNHVGLYKNLKSTNFGIDFKNCVIYELAIVPIGLCNCMKLHSLYSGLQIQKFPHDLSLYVQVLSKLFQTCVHIVLRP